MEGNPITKKSYNPFKMWGSWVGAVIGGGSIIIIAGGITTLILLSFFGLCEGRFCSDSNGYLVLAVVLIPRIIIGFLLGWGIHSLIRRLRK